MESFNKYINEKSGGKKAGKLEIAKINVATARAYAEKKFAENGFDLDVEIPDFDKNFAIAKAKAIFGLTLRKDMPVLEKKDVRLLQTFLKKGSIDLAGPWSSDEVAKDPFPEGLRGAEAKRFFVRGLRVYDGAKVDDIIKVKRGAVTAQKLIPIQGQIYFDKGIDKQAVEGAKGSRHFMTNKTTFVVSSDLRIIDGHHRLLSSLLLDPQMKVKVLMIDLPIDKLLPLTLAFSDAIGNKRNH